MWGEVVKWRGGEVARWWGGGMWGMSRDTGTGGILQPRGTARTAARPVICAVLRAPLNMRWPPCGPSSRWLKSEGARPAVCSNTLGRPKSLLSGPSSSSEIGQPAAASMARRECFTSASRLVLNAVKLAMAGPAQLHRSLPFRLDRLSCASRVRGAAIGREKPPPGG